MIGHREGGQVVKHVYAFKSQRVKDNWLRTLRFARTKLGKDKISSANRFLHRTNCANYTTCIGCFWLP